MRLEQNDWARYKGIPAIVMWVSADGQTVGILLRDEAVTREVKASELSQVLKH